MASPVLCAKGCEMNAETMARLLEYADLKEFFHDNSPVRLAVLFCAICIMLVIAHFLCSIFQKKLEETMSSAHQTQARNGTDTKPLTHMDFDLFERVMRSTRLGLYTLIFGWGFKQLALGPIYAEIIHILFGVLCIWVGIRFFSAFIPFNIDIYLRRHGTTLRNSQSRSLMPIIKGIIWAIGLTFMLDNLGFHVSTIIAGLGIVGVAVGLAGQAILADFFSYIVILLDKPFRIGDFVEIGENKSGEVEYMGPKTTHLRNLDGDLIVCANAEMTKGILVNQGSIHEREVITQIGIAYDTPLPQIKKLPDLLADVVNSFPQCSFDRACLLTFGDSSLNFQLIYMVSQQRGGLRDFMNTRSQVNMAILEKFDAEGINIPYPTEHVLLSNLDARKNVLAPKPESEETTGK